MQIKDIKNMTLDELKIHEAWLKDQIKAAKKAETAKKKENERALNKRRNHRLIVLGGGLDSILKQANPAVQLADLSDEEFVELNRVWRAYLNKYSVAIAELMGKAITVAKEKKKQEEAGAEKEDTENAVTAEQRNEESVDNSSEPAIPDRTAAAENREMLVAAQGANEQTMSYTQSQVMYPGYTQPQMQMIPQPGGIVTNNMSINQPGAATNNMNNTASTSMPPWMLSENQDMPGQFVGGGAQ